MTKGTYGVHRHQHTQTRFSVIPTPEKLAVNPEFEGRGVRIAFLDSGFFPHPDIEDRVAAFHDISDEERAFADIKRPLPHHWHGTQTVVACAGSGKLSEGIYRGIASSAELVLVKVSKNGRIGDEGIEMGLQWVLENRTRLDLRILNISLGGDCDRTLPESRINLLAERLVEEGVVVTVAAGNSASKRPIPPASSPSVITVGGYSDENMLEPAAFELYHSSYGHTADGHLKPEVIAPAMYVAAPILPGTEDYCIAEALSLLMSSPDHSFRANFDEAGRAAGLPDIVREMSIKDARLLVESEIARRKIISTHYQHVDGTSFAAPIVASVVAQMIEANRSLTPLAVKNILISTAERLSGHPAVRQGYGVISAAEAVRMSLGEGHLLTHSEFGPPRISGSSIVFLFHDDNARSVSLAGNFNNWSIAATPFIKTSEGLWRAEIPCKGRCRLEYKIVLNGERWVEDPTHGRKEPDGFGGFNSVVAIC